MRSSKILSALDYFQREMPKGVSLFLFFHYCSGMVRLFFIGSGKNNLGPNIDYLKEVKAITIRYHYILKENIWMCVLQKVFTKIG